MSINYFGALRMSEAVLPAMMAARDGAIVNVSSILASVGTPTTANYGATKAALEAFSYGLRHEMQAYGVKVTVFIAPHTQTAMGEAAEFKGVRSFSPSWVARELVRALDATPRRYVARGVLRMGLRLAAWFPSYMEAQLSAMVRHRLPEEPSRPRGCSTRGSRS